MSPAEEIDLYEVLGISSSASKSEVKKAYHKAALSSHPDKVPETQRSDAEIRFKNVSRAYEILSNDDDRHLYDTHGMSAFEKGAGGPTEVNVDELFAQMFGMGGMGGMGGMPGMGGMGEGMPGGRRREKMKGKDEVQNYEVTLEELYKGKTTRFASTKNVLCKSCHGSGGKDKAKPIKCAACEGQGRVARIRQVGFTMQQEVSACGACKGAGQVYKDKDKCKKCKGARTMSEKKILELYIPRGSREGEQIRLAGEGDQLPDQEPGDIVFILEETRHATFERAGPDLQADLHVSLSEALTGFDRVVLTHLDGRDIRLHVKQPKGKILRPDQVLKVAGEGMPVKKSDAKGDLYLVVKIDFPDDGWIQNTAMVDKIRQALPQPPTAPKAADVVDEVEFEEVEGLEEFGAGSDDPRAGGEWEEDDLEQEGVQCQTQ